MKVPTGTGLLVAALLAAGAAQAQAQAQAYPAKPVQMIIPLAAASAADVMLRIVAQKMAENMGQQIIIENVPGASGLIGGERTARAAPDGYTLGGFSDTVISTVPLMYSKAGYDSFKSFAPVSMVAGITVTMFVHPSLPAKTVAEFIALAKSRPGQIDYASGGNGSPMHVMMAMFEQATGTSLTHVPYKGSTQAVLDIVSGRVPVMITSLAAVLEFIRAGKLRSIGVASRQRSVLVPDVPTISEAGVPGFVALPWSAIFVPQNTPAAIVERLNAEVVKAVGDNGVRQRLLALAFEPGAGTPEQLGAETRAAHTRMAKLVKDLGLTVN